MIDLSSGFESRFITAQDGLRLHCRLYGERQDGVIPVVCLPGLTRNAKDFHTLASALAAAGRFVVAVDYRGRGQSAHDPDPTHYAVPVEAGDVLAITTALGLAEVVFIGTSRGGLITMVLSALRPGLIKAVVLNDVGPVIEAAGLLRIKSYVGKGTPPATWGEAVAGAKRIAGTQFPALSDDDWALFVRQIFSEKDGRLVADYDPALANGLTAWTPDQPIPELWPQFEGLKAIPVMLIRGALTDLLSEKTVKEMQVRHPGLAVLTVEGQGHAPLLNDAPTIAAIKAFIDKAA